MFLTEYFTGFVMLLFTLDNRRFTEAKNVLTCKLVEMYQHITGAKNKFFQNQVFFVFIDLFVRLFFLWGGLPKKEKVICIYCALSNDTWY